MCSACMQSAPKHCLLAAALLEHCSTVLSQEFVAGTSQDCGTGLRGIGGVAGCISAHDNPSQDGGV